MRGAERHLHSEENVFVIPHFRKEITAFVQANSVDWQRSGHAFAHITGQTLRRHWTIS